MAQPFITLRLVDDDGATARKLNINATNIATYARWRTNAPGADYREGVVNSVVTMVNGNQHYVRETPAEIEALLAVV